MKNKLVLKLIVTFLAFAVIGVAVYIVNMPTAGSQNESLPSDAPVIVEIEKNNNLNKIELGLVSQYTTYYKNALIGNLNLIDGSYANRTVWIFSISNMENLPSLFKELIIYDGEQQLSIDEVAMQYNEEDVIVIAAADNIIESENFKYAITVVDPKTNEEKTFERKAKQATLSSADDAYNGMLINVQKDGYWVRKENGEQEDRISKNGDKGPYFEYMRTLNFYSFGKNSTIDENKIDVVIDSDLNFEYDIHISEKEGSENVDYKHEPNIGTKTIIVTIKVYEGSLSDEENRKLISAIDRGYLEYGKSQIHLSDGILGSEHHSTGND